MVGVCYDNALRCPSERPSRGGVQVPQGGWRALYGCSGVICSPDASMSIDPGFLYSSADGEARMQLNRR